jgi:hypothetical protein
MGQPNSNTVKDVLQENNVPIMITIEESLYNDLLDRDNTLAALENAGVDNWEGFDIAMDALNED